MRRAAGLALGLALVGILAMSALDHLIFFPEPGAPPPPPGVEERWITTPDGVRLHAWWAPAPAAADGPPAPVLLWSHGNGGNVALREDVLLALAAAGVDVLAYDYRGYGRSEGRPTEAGVYRDAAAVWDDLQARGVPAERIVAFGESLGVSLLVAHGDQDEIVPYELGLALFGAAAEPKRFVRVAGAGHNDVFAAPGLIAEITAFARAAVSR